MPKIQNTKQMRPDRTQRGRRSPMPRSVKAVATASILANWESMPKINIIKKKRMAKKKLPGIWQIAMGNATKASPVPERPIDLRLSKVWPAMQGSVSCSSAARKPKTGKTTQPAIIEVKQLINATPEASRTKLADFFPKEPKDVIQPYPIPKEKKIWTAPWIQTWGSAKWL